MKNLVILLAFVFAVSISLSAQSTGKKEVKKTQVTKTTTLSTDKKCDDKVSTTTGVKSTDKKKMDMKECKEGTDAGCCSDMKTKKTETVKKDVDAKEDQKK